MQLLSDKILVMASIVRKKEALEAASSAQALPEVAFVPHTHHQAWFQLLRAHARLLRQVEQRLEAGRSDSAQLV